MSSNNEVNEVFISVMALQEAQTHQLRLQDKGVSLSLKTNGETCTTGCKVTVEVWGVEADRSLLQEYFNSEFMKNIQGHLPNFDHLAQVFDPLAAEVICQACGMKFSPTMNECPECGLVYS
jgi:hypothetical protein